MLSRKRLTTVIKTNWIHLLGFYICIELFMVVSAIIDSKHHYQLQLFVFQLLLPALMLLFTYGLVPLIAFYLILLLLDLVLLTQTKLAIFDIVLIEWIIIAPIFIYWAFKYDYWLWLLLVSSFLVTQFIRARRAAGLYPGLG